MLKIRQPIPPSTSDSIRPNSAFRANRTAFNVAKTIFHEISYVFQAGYKNFISFAKNRHLELSPKNNRNGLVVCFHGLNGNPTVYRGHINKFKEIAKESSKLKLSYYAPKVPNRGHCTLKDEGIDTICSNIQKWITNNPDKPVVIFGQSNGSRVALEIETRLRELAPTTPVYLSLTGAVIYGTSLINRITKVIKPKLLALISFGALTEVCIEELKYEGSSSKELLSKAQKELPKGCAVRRARLYAAECDSHVWSMGSSLPTLNFKSEKHYIVPGYGHNSIVNACKDEQVEKTFHWIQSQNKKENCNHCLRKTKDGGKTLHLPTDDRSLIAKIADRVKWIFNSIKMIFVRLHDLMAQKFHPEEFLTVEKPKIGDSFVYPTDMLPWNKDPKKESAGLNLCIHGLNGSPLHWTRYVKQLKQERPEMDTLSPHVHLKGNCSLEDAAQPLLLLVQDYMQKNPGKPVNIIGTSNGGRIAAYIESNLEPELVQGRDLTITSIAGVHFGTKMVDRLKRFKLIKFAKLHKTLAKEFEWGSEAAQVLHQKWRERQKVWQQPRYNVRHIICASTEDEQVRSIAASLPKRPLIKKLDAGIKKQDADYIQIIYHGESHTSIVEKAQRDIIGYIFDKSYGLS